MFDVQVTTGDLCGQDREQLADWFIHHGAPSLLLHPLPEYVTPILNNPYDNPENPPEDPNPGRKIL